MRVKLRLVLCSDDGREEIVTDIVSLKKDCHRIEQLGLTLAESKHLLFCASQWFPLSHGSCFSNGSRSSLVFITYLGLS
jgi:hypothetical protein